MNIRVKRRPLDPSEPENGRVRATLRSRLRALATRARASPWASLLTRVVAALAALVVLGLIGRSAMASAGATEASAPASASSAAEGPLSSAPAHASLDAPMLDAAATATAVPATAARAARASADDPVYLNQASVADLRRLPGVGPKRAEAIVALRRRVGRFQRVEDLLRVKGVGRGTLRKWRPLVRLDAPSPADAGAVAPAATSGAGGM